MGKRKKSQIEEEFDAYVRKELEKGGSEDDESEAHYNFEEMEELFNANYTHKEPPKKIQKHKLLNIVVPEVKNSSEKKQQEEEDLEEWFKTIIEE
jgi:hypothetical protein